jgi:hypothetical protein
MSAAHTAGPWAVAADEIGHHYFIGPKDGDAVVVLERHVAGHDASDMPNAQLVAAAPELLEALQQAERTLVNAYGLPEGVQHPTLQMVRAAIAKAVQA